MSRALGHKLRLFASAILLLQASVAFAGKVVTLYDSKGRQWPDYDRRVASVRPGDIVVLGPNPEDRIEVAETLSNAKRNFASKIWVDRETGDVIRVPAGRGKLNKYSYMEWFNSYIEAFRRLAELVPASRLPEEVVSVEGRYIRQKRYRKHFDFGQYEHSDKIDPELKAKAQEDFIPFVRDLALVAKVGDIKPSQIVYTDHGWILTDGCTPVRKAYAGWTVSIFDDLDLSREDTKIVRAVIVEERQGRCIDAELARAIEEGRAR